MISLVSTVFNDREGMLSFLRAMEGQSRCPDEIVIVDAGSRDGTWELLQEESRQTGRPWSFRAIQEKRCNVARGRNLAIEAAGGDIIVSTDIGCDWDPEWLEELATPLLSDPSMELVNGSWAVRKDDLHGPWALTEWALKGEQTFEATEDCHPSSRSIAYRKNVWKALGGYPEDLTLAGDDAMFDFLIAKAGVRRAAAPVIRCYWHRHESLSGFFKEAWRYGVGDGEAFIRLRDIVLIGGRMLFEVLAPILGILLMLLGGRPGLATGGLLFLGVIVSLLARVWRSRGASHRLRMEGVDRPLRRILLLSYGTKWNWLRGFFRGSLRGFRKCRDCRHRLRSMSPRLYREGVSGGNPS